MPRIRPISDEELDEMIAVTETKFVTAAHRTFEAAAAAVRMSITAAGSEPVSADDAAVAASVWKQEMVNLLPFVNDAFNASAFGVIGAVGDAVLPPQANAYFGVPKILDQAATDHLSSAANRLSRFGDTAWNEVRGALVTGFQQGEGIDKLADRVRKAGVETEARARTIARTEVISASNAGAFASSQSLPPVLRPQNKEWLATHDSRTRPAHAAADGQIVDMDSQFSVGGASLRYPGDPMGPASEIVNCRCTILFDVADVHARCSESLAAAGAADGPVSVFKQVRLSLGLSRKQMADHLGWSQFKLDKIELGKAKASDADLAKLFTVPGYQDKYAALSGATHMQAQATPPAAPVTQPDETVIGGCVISSQDTSHSEMPSTIEPNEFVNETGHTEHLVPKSRISQSAYNALDPRVTPFNPPHVRRVMETSQEGSDEAILYRTMSKFQASTSQTQVYRKDIAKIVSGRGDALSGEARQRMEIFLDAMQNSPKPPNKLFRGMNFDQDSVRKLKESYRVGDTIDMDVASFSTSHTRANGFAGVNSEGYGPGGLGARRKIMLELDDAEHALPFENLTTTFHSEKEWVTNGRFRVVSIDDTADAIKIRIRQEQVLNPTGQLVNVGTRAEIEAGKRAAAVVRNTAPDMFTSTGVKFDEILAGTNSEAMAELTYLPTKMIDIISPDFKAALTTYRARAGGINRYLRGIDTQLTSQIVDDVKIIDAAFERGVPLTEDAIVHRQVDAKMAAELRKHIGQNFFDSGYTTTKFDDPLATPGFTNIDIFVPKGTTMLPTDAVTHEAVLPRTSKFRVLGEVGGRLRLEYIP